jgi:diaminopimelate epimerase
MKDVSNIEILEEGIFLDTGSPHHVVFTESVETIDVFKVGR